MRNRSFDSNKYTSTHTTNTKITLTMERTLIKAITSTHTTNTTKTTPIIKATLIKAIIKTS